MDLDNTEHELNVLSLTRIQPLLEQVRQRDLKFRYFITIPYRYKNTDYNSVIKDNRVMRKSIRSFFKSNIRMWFFIERHSDQEGKHYGGFHRHILMEAIPTDIWHNPSNKLMNLLVDVNPELLFAKRFRSSISDSDKIAVLKKVLRLNNSVPNGSCGVSIQEIFVLNRLLAYCSKQFEKGLPAYEVLDPSSSDIDMTYLLRNKQNGLQWKPRQESTPERTDLFVQVATQKQVPIRCGTT